ncbi:ATP-binding cassette domain-containing protein [Streptomyces sp. NPDC047108]|uniref:ABC transporter ATP-binding protein n=1 Tax=Streptomyces sp. NPDC047108 TaxID=3155025 RepID=UPI0033FA795C
MTPYVARVDSLRVEAGGRALVDGVGLELRPGRCTALVGASGSGKTTTGLALLGAFPSGARVSGTVDVPGGRIGYIPQNPAAALNPARRVGALLADIARLDGGRRRSRAARVHGALRLAQLPDPAAVLRRFPHELSGGQQQRVVLAQAFLLGARVVVADEPTTGQDDLTKRRVVAELRALRPRGIAVLLLSHDLEVVRELADDVVVLEEGRVVESGPAADVFAAPEHPWTRQLLSAAAPPADPEDRPRDAPRSRHGTDSGGGGPDRPASGGDPDRPASGAGPDRHASDGGPAHRTGGAIEVTGLTAWHGPRRSATTVLDAVALTVVAGECLAVVGRSGSGKTTLARCLAGLHRQWSGRAVLDGSALPRSLRDRTRTDLASLQYVFQDARASFDEYRPVLDQVARTAVRLRGLGREAARHEALDALARVGLSPETAGRRPAALSGGELQRAALARALLARPRVLVCDEITSGLDTVARRGIRDLLRRLQRDELTSLVLITHDLAVAADLADSIAVVDAGRVVEHGPAATLRSRPRHPRTAELFRVPRLAEASPPRALGPPRAPGPPSVQGPASRTAGTGGPG